MASAVSVSLPRRGFRPPTTLRSPPVISPLAALEEFIKVSPPKIPIEILHSIKSIPNPGIRRCKPVKPEILIGIPCLWSPPVLLWSSIIQRSANRVQSHERKYSASNRRVSAFFASPSINIDSDDEFDISTSESKIDDSAFSPRHTSIAVPGSSAIELESMKPMLVIQESNIEIITSDHIEFAAIDEGEEIEISDDGGDEDENENESADEFLLDSILGKTSNRNSISQSRLTPLPVRRRKSSTFLESLSLYVEMTSDTAELVNHADSISLSEIPKLNPPAKSLRPAIPQSAVEFVKSANRALRVGDFATCADECSRALQIAPLYPNAYFSRALASSGKGDYHAVIVDCSFYLELTLDTPTAAQLDKALYNRALAFFMVGEYSQSRSDYDRLLKLKPKFALAYTGRGNVLVKLNERFLAMQDFRAGAALEPTEATLMPLAVALAISNEFAESKKHATTVLAMNPASAQALFHRGACNLKLSDYVGGIKDYSLALSLEPYRVEAYGKRGSCFIYCGEFEKALIDFRTLLARKPGDLIAENAIQFCEEQLNNQPFEEFVADNINKRSSLALV